MAEDEAHNPPTAAEDHPRRSQGNDHNGSAEDRDWTAEDRDRTADDRDKLSQAHDVVAESRDTAADARDRRAERRDKAVTGLGSEAGSDSAGARVDRAGGAIDRSRAAGDRTAASGDRTAASGDRTAASRDRARSAQDRATASIDELTGAHRRDAGMVELAREMARAKRTKKALVLAFVDVDRLKATNDSFGHGAGDQLLCRVVHTMRAHLRSYDLITRVGGDEFICALPDLTTAQAVERFLIVNAELAAASPHASITAGVTELQAEDSLEGLIARADAALRAQRQQRSTAQA